MGKAEKIQYAGKESEDSGTTHFRIENEDTLRSDLEFLVGKMGVSIEQLKQERYQKEKQAKQDEIDRRAEKKRKARELREAQLDELFLKEYGKRFFITLNGTRLKQFKDFKPLSCPECGAPLQSFKGWCQQISEQPPGMFIAATPNPLSVFGAVPCILTTIECGKKHNIELLIQQLY